MNRLAAFLLLALTSTGCSYLNEMSALRHEIERSTDASFDTGVTLSLGSGLTQTASWITRNVDDADAQNVSRALDGVRRMKGAVYPVEHAGDLLALDPLELDHFRRGGWEVALKTLTSYDVSWVLYRQRGGSVHDLYTVVLTEDELVLVRLRGHLNALLDLTIEEADTITDW